MSDSQSYEVPGDYFYTKDHEWIKPKNGSYLVGITDYAAKMLNDIVYVNLPKEGVSMRQKDVYGQVESVKTVSDMYMPVSGTIIRTNNQLTQTPELVANSPYVQGWMLEITADSFSEESRDLLSAKAYNNFVSTLKDIQ
jgi:glycine cleavage system H protein